MLTLPRGTWRCIADVRRWWEERNSLPLRVGEADERAPLAAEREGAAAPVVGDAAGKMDLLSRRMLALHLDPSEFARAELSALSELQRLCGRCRHRVQCEGDLADEFADPAWQNWRDYCPNANALSILSALRGCAPEATT